MAWYFPLNNLTNASSVDRIGSYVNEVTCANGTCGLFFPLILVALFVVTFFMIAPRWGERKAFFTSSMITTVISILFLGLGWVPSYLVIIPIMMTAFSLLILKRE
tara:strand:+ start:2466 stop:2780 length:315 start_codon:yes stop_codon:yes gene_type:complete